MWSIPLPVSEVTAPVPEYIPNTGKRLNFHWQADLVDENHNPRARSNIADVSNHPKTGWVAHLIDATGLEANVCAC
jgi:hypothetical protein